MKKCALIIVLLLTVSVYAAVQLTLTVPDAAVPVVMETFNTLAGTHMTLEARGHAREPEDEFDGRWDFRIAPKDPNETNKQFTERFTKELIRASVRLVESAKEYKRYREEVGAVKPPDVNVPDGIIE